jgi:hypothetical protein
MSFAQRAVDIATVHDGIDRHSSLLLTQPVEARDGEFAPPGSGGQGGAVAYLLDGDHQRE